MTMLLDWPEVETEDARAMWQRRYQQRRCLVCGARRTRNQQTSYFCTAHYDDWRYCSTCATLRPADMHGKDTRCKGCAARKSLAQYYVNPDRCRYRLRLNQLSRRQHNQADRIFIAIRRQIALAELVRCTPGMSWQARGRLVGYDPTHLAESYRRQSRG